MNSEDEKDDKTKNPGSSSNNKNQNPSQNHDHDNPKKSTTGNGSNDTRACAACKYQRRRCAPDCALAPYFPPDHQKQFLNAHKLFGLKNMMKVYKRVKPNERNVAMKSMIFEANMRARDPVGGSHRIIEELQKQIQFYKAELSFVLNQLALAQNINNNNTTNSSAAAASAGCSGSKDPVVVNPNLMSTGYVAAQPMQFQEDSSVDLMGGFYADFYQAATLGDIEAITSPVDINPAVPLLLGEGSGVMELMSESQESKPDLAVLSLKDEEQKYVPTQLHDQREYEGQTSMFSQKTSEFNDQTVAGNVSWRKLRF